MRIATPILALIFCTSTAGAQPAFFEPTQGYFKARGSKVTALWNLDRVEVPEDGVLTATLAIRGATNPLEIVRPDLAKVRDDEGRHPFTDRFQIEDVPGPAAKPDAKEVQFVYRLRPRNRDVDKLPSLEFWYDTGKKVGNPFQKTWAKGPKLVVMAAVKVKPPAVPLLEPDHLFEIETDSRVLAREPFAAGWISWLLLFVLGVLIAGIWYAAWRRIYPDGARLARLRRGRAVRRAADAIRRAGRSRDPAGAIAAAVLGYLRARFPLPPGAETPSEVGEGLRECSSHAPREEHRAAQ